MGDGVADRIEVGKNAFIERCPKCNGSNVGVIDSRPEPYGRRRRRRCLGCGNRWNTVEVPEEFARGVHDTRRRLDITIAEITRLRDAIPQMDAVAPVDDMEC